MQAEVRNELLEKQEKRESTKKVKRRRYSHGKWFEI